MAWIALTEANIQTELSAQELKAVQTYALANNQPDPMPGTIGAAMDEIRGYIAGSRNTILGELGTIPEELIATGISLVVWRLIKRFPTKVMATEARKNDYNEAIFRLKDVARNLFRFAPPENPTTEAPAQTLGPTISNNGVRYRNRVEQNEV